MNLVAFILFIAIIGGGIYLWVTWKRKRVISRHKKLVEDAGLLDQSGNILPGALDKLARGRSEQKGQSATGQTSTHSEASATPLDKDNQAGLPQDNGTTAQANVGAPPAQAAPLKKDGAYVTRLRRGAPQIRELTEALLAAWREATDQDQRWDTNRSTRNSISYDLQRAQDLSRIKAVAEIQPATIRIIETQLLFDQFEVAGAQLLADLLPRARQAKTAWQALVDALRSYPDEDDLDDLPTDLKALLLTAHQVRSVSKSSIESLLSEGAAYTERNASLLSTAVARNAGNTAAKPAGKAASPSAAETPAQSDPAQKEKLRLLEAGRQAIQQKVEALLSVMLTTRAAYMELHGLRETLKHKEEMPVVKPRKPTPEEVTRYLCEVEEKACARMLSGRVILAAAQTLEERLRELNEARESLLATLKREAAPLNASGKGVLVGTVKCGDYVHSNLGEWSRSIAKAISETRSAGYDSTKPVPTNTPEEDALDKELRQLARTLGFAVAQHVVATAKLRSVKNSEPSEPGKARVDREQDFDANLARTESYLTRLAKFHDDWDRFAKEKEVVEVALQARLAKIKESTKLLDSRAAAVSRTLKADSADLLRLSASAARDLVNLMGEYTKDSL